MGKFVGLKTCTNKVGWFFIVRFNLDDSGKHVILTSNRFSRGLLVQLRLIIGCFGMGLLKDWEAVVMHGLVE